MPARSAVYAVVNYLSLTPELKVNSGIVQEATAKPSAREVMNPPGARRIRNVYPGSMSNPDVGTRGDLITAAGGE